MEKLPILSLFSGAGGLDLGFEEADFDPLIALDLDPVAAETFNHNREGRDPAAVVDLASARPLDLIKRWEQASGGDKRPVGVIGGPPCRAFSVGNVHKIHDDPRARLPIAYSRILRAFNDRFDLDFFVFENVVGLGHQRHSSSLQMFIEKFEQAGFSVKSFFLDAVDFEVAQYRERMFIVGFNSKRFDAFFYAPPVGAGRARTVRETIEGVAEPMFFTRGKRPTEIGLHPNNWCMNPRSKKFVNGALKSGKMPGRSFRMLEWDAPSWTVAYGHREVHVHPNGQRRLSVFEAMMLQGFPPEYELGGTLSDQIRLVSDAVPPPLAFALAQTIRVFAYGSQPSSAGADTQAAASGQTEHAGIQGRQTTAPRSVRP